MSARYRKPIEPAKLLGLGVVLLVSEPQLGILFFMGWGIVTVIKKAAAKPKHSAARYPAAKTEKFDECPQRLFCFHKDKGVHHVRKGREIDPWDRPDIDISKYQRRN